MKVTFMVLAVALGCSSRVALAQSDTVVTTYVTKVQESRRSTRFTLTEWLRIKERMKLMDVWLAMFSNPKKDTFHPELNLIHYQMRGDLRYTAADEAESDKGEIAGHSTRAQLYLTNLFTGTTGVKLLNIDFGLEGGVRHGGEYEPDSTVTYEAARKYTNTTWMGNFRIFGKNIQDSSLVLKVGQYQVRNGVANLSGTNDHGLARGTLLGGELQLYLFRWLGLEGSYFDFGESARSADGWKTKGTYQEYMAYVEVSLLRLMFGQYQEGWSYAHESFDASSKESGFLGGVKLQL